MALLQEIEDNFSKLKAYKLVNCQENLRGKKFNDSLMFLFSLLKINS